MKKLFFIINPVAGRGMYKQGLGEDAHAGGEAGEPDERGAAYELGYV